MNQKAWDEIESIYYLDNVDIKTVEMFNDLKSGSQVHTKGEGNPRHYNSLFLPYDKAKGMIYLGNHIKADDWIPPGGHIEKGETPKDTCIREMKEEFGVDITRDQLQAFNISVKPINRLEFNCMAHYDVWHLVHIKYQVFDFIKTEYYDAGWFTISDGIAKITKNPDFAKIISDLQPPGL